MVDTQITRWAREHGGAHSYAAIGGPDLERVPWLRPGGVLRESDWAFIVEHVVANSRRRYSLNVQNEGGAPETWRWRFSPLKGATI